MVLNDFFPRHIVIASHIWKRYTHGDGLEDFGLSTNDINNPRNGLLLYKSIEEAFNVKNICFLVNTIDSSEIIVKVLCPDIISNFIFPNTNSNIKFSDIDGRKLHYPDDEHIPFRRILHFHAKMSFQHAIKRNWIPNDSSFIDYFNMSIGASIPDFDYKEESIDGDSEW